jgi:hypothetical protein
MQCYVDFNTILSVSATKWLAFWKTMPFCRNGLADQWKTFDAQIGGVA